MGLHITLERMPQCNRSFSCTGCAGCCKQATILPLSDTDLRRLSARFPLERLVTGVSVDAGYACGEQIVRRLALARTAQGCALLDWDRCSAYDLRPTVCRLFPYVVDAVKVTATGDLHGYMSLNHGALYPDESHAACGGIGAAHQLPVLDNSLDMAARQYVREQVTYLGKLVSLGMVEGDLLHGDALDIGKARAVMEYALTLESAIQVLGSAGVIASNGFLELRRVAYLPRAQRPAAMLPKLAVETGLPPDRQFAA